MRRLVMKRHLSFVAALGMCLFGLNVSVDAQQIRAETGGIAIGGSVTGSTINIGVPPEQLAALVRQAADLSETQKKVIAKLEGELDLNQRQISSTLGILGENDIPPERLAAKLVEIAERFKDLQATASAQPGDDPKIAALKIDARKAIEAGELAKADALLADVETEQRRALDRVPLDWARIQDRLGIALTVFGRRQSGTAKLEEAIATFREALKERTRERVPLDWAMTQTNLGAALFRLGERESGTAKLEGAVAVYREALK